VTGSTKDGARSRRRTRAAVTTAAAIAVATAFAVPAQANLSAVGPTNAVTGVPAWYADAVGNKLALCIDDVNCGPNSTLADFLAPDGSGEAFYWRGVSNDVAIGGGTVATSFSLEAAFPNGAGTPPQTFVRMRIKAKGVTPGTYRIDSPYGSFDVVSDGVKVNLGPSDVVCVQPAVSAPCNFGSILGVSPTGTDLVAFLHGTGMPAGYFGNGAGTSVVTGGNNAVNTLTVTAPDRSKASTDQWTITGKQFDPNAAPIAPLSTPAPIQAPAPTGAGTAAGSTAGQVAGVSASSPLAVSRLSLARRISVARLRVEGLRASMNVPKGTKVVRIAIYKARNGARTGRALFTTTRTLRSAGLFRITLRGRALSRLKPGEYVMEAQAGRSSGSPGAVRRVVFRVTR
jgi:hypothetical protein